MTGSPYPGCVAVMEMLTGRFVQPVTNETRYEAPVATETEAVTSSSQEVNVESFQYVFER